MRRIQENLLVRFSVASFIIIFLLGFGLMSYLSAGLDHQIEDMQMHNASMIAHNASMAAGTFDLMGRQGMMNESNDEHVMGSMDSMSQQGMSDSSDSDHVTGDDHQDGMAMTDTMIRTVEASDAAHTPDAALDEGMSDDAGHDHPADTGVVDTILSFVSGSNAADTPDAALSHGDDVSMPHIIQNVSRIKTTTVGLVGGAFIVLYASLVFIVWGGSRTINRQQASLVTANSDMELANRGLKAFTTKLEVSNQELQDFASIAAHDLQEPLRKVQAFGDRLKSKYAEALEEQGREYLDRMQNASGRMSILINDLLTYSRVVSKGQPFESTDLNVVASEVVSDLETRIEELEGRVEFEDLPTIDADSMQMRQLFQNVIGNALKYHMPDEAPVVKVYGKMLNSPAVNGALGIPEDKMCEITFEDNGIGFDEKYLDRIFGIFQRLQTRGEYEGTGVGLAVCRKIADRHSGTITARSRPDHGATFIVTLPVKQHESEGVISQ